MGEKHQFGAQGLMASVNNIERLRVERDWSRPQLGKLMGTSGQQIERLEKGQRELTVTWIDKAADAFNVRPWQIITPEGEGPYAEESIRSGTIVPPAANDDVVEIIALDLSLSMGPGTLIEDMVEAAPVKMDLGLVQSITRTPSDRLRLVRGTGDSMEPTLRSSDRVMVDLNERSMTRISGIYWISREGAHGIKRLRPAGKGKVTIVSDNPIEDNYDVDAEEIRIEGRVIWFAREL